MQRLVELEEQQQPALTHPADQDQGQDQDQDHQQGQEDELAARQKRKGAWDGEREDTKKPRL